MATFDEILQRALALPPRERLQLADTLFESVTDDELPEARAMEPEIEAAWSRELERRIQELDEGKVTAIPAEEVIESMKARLRQLS